MAWSLIASGINGNGGTTVSVGPLDMTGVDLIVGIACHYTGAAANGSLTDDSSNGYTKQLTQASAGDAFMICDGFYTFNPTVDNAMTFTFTIGGLILPSLAIYGFSGLSGSPSVTSVSSGTGSTSLQAGSIGSSGDMVVEGLGWYANNGMSIDSGFATPLEQPYVAAGAIGCGGSYKSVSGAENPTWSWSGSNVATGVAMAFPGGGGGGGGDQPMMRRWGGRSGPVPGIGQSSGGGKAWG